MSSCSIELTTESPRETAAVGAVLAAWLHEGDVLLLHGDLGAGKTVLAKGIAAALGVDSVVASPSFALVNEYEAGLIAPVTRLYHLDLYRLSEAGALASIGFDDLVIPVDGATLVEWPERAAGALPDRYILIEIEPTGVDRRQISIVAAPQDGSWIDRITDLRKRLATHGM